MIGKKYNRWTIIDVAPSIRTRNTVRKYFVCRCDCGTIRNVDAGNLTSGASKSCGCWRRENSSRMHYRHGHRRNGQSRTYTSWMHMVARCTKPQTRFYEYYGGRGIKVCDRWRESFENFLVDMGECPKGLTIDRIDTNGNYEPGNCRWITMQEQNSNRRSTIKMPLNGRRVSMKEFAKAHNMTYAKFQYWYRFKKLSVDEILSKHAS